MFPVSLHRLAFAPSRFTRFASTSGPNWPAFHVPKPKKHNLDDIKDPLERPSNVPRNREKQASEKIEEMQSKKMEADKRKSETKPITESSQIPPKPEFPQAIPLQHLEKPKPKSPFADEQLGILQLADESISREAFSQEIQDILTQPVKISDLWIKPGNLGLVYLKKQVYHDLLNKAFTEKGWKLIPKGPMTIYGTSISRPFILVINNRFISEARGEFSTSILPPNPAHDEKVKEELEYTALVRVCKDLLMASELWDPRWLRQFRQEHVDKKWDKTTNSFHFFIKK